MYDRQEGNYIWLVRSGHTMSSLQQTVRAQQPRSAFRLSARTRSPAPFQSTSQTCLSGESLQKSLVSVWMCAIVKKKSTETAMTFALSAKTERCLTSLHIPIWLLQMSLLTAAAAGEYFAWDHFSFLDIWNSRGTRQLAKQHSVLENPDCSKASDRWLWRYQQLGDKRWVPPLDLIQGRRASLLAGLVKFKLF